ncbi:MAG: N-acetyl-gamma-glutamyl-phosphate reductase, partial [Clostridiales bacterium]|nr:N-acetyl-gamma-glutamyl-phosphate reductase [Clostridiales bacterium]
MIKVGIIGANGYTGGELLRLLAGHSGVKVTYVTSRSEAGKRVAEAFPALSVYKDLRFSEFSAEAAARECQTVFLCLPHAAGAAAAGALRESGLRLIDLSADFRYRDVGLYEKTYKVTHPARELNKTAVYGLPELNRAEIKKADLISNPGCYTTCSILPLYPLIKENIIAHSSVIIDAASGTSGAGKKAEFDFSFCEVNENFKAYAVTTHRHASEIEAILSEHTQKAVTVCFTPHLLPVQRGILATIYAPVKKAGLTPAEVDGVYNKYYGDERFVS